MDANRKVGKSPEASVLGSIVSSGMLADDVSAKPAPLLSRSNCLRRIASFSWWSPGQAWQIVFAYARRWQIELSLRFTKSELAFESPRLLKWESRLKFLLIASLAYAFLLSLLPNTDFLFRLIATYCHRTGKWSQEISAPLYRLRLALSRLWLEFRPHSLPKLIPG